MLNICAKLQTHFMPSWRIHPDSQHTEYSKVVQIKDTRAYLDFMLHHFFLARRSILLLVVSFKSFGSLVWCWLSDPQHLLTLKVICLLRVTFLLFMTCPFTYDDGWPLCSCFLRVFFSTTELKRLAIVTKMFIHASHPWISDGTFEKNIAVPHTVHSSMGLHSLMVHTLAYSVTSFLEINQNWSKKQTLWTREKVVFFAQKWTKETSVQAHQEQNL